MADETKAEEAPEEVTEVPEAEEAPEEVAEVQDAEEAPDEEFVLSLDEAKGWVGFKLDELGGQAVGKVEAVYVDDTSGRPEWLLARMGRFGHHCLVPARDAVAAGGHVWIPYARDQIRKAPRTEPSAALECDRERSLLEHYGIGTSEAGRGAELSDRGPSDITARPA